MASVHTSSPSVRRRRLWRMRTHDGETPSSGGVGKSDEKSRGTASMASAWNYSSFMPSAAARKLTNNQCVRWGRARSSQGRSARESRGLLKLCAAHKPCASDQARYRQGLRSQIEPSPIPLILLYLSRRGRRHATCTSLGVNEDCGSPHCCSLWRLHPEAQLLRASPGLSPRDAIPTASRLSMAFVRGSQRAHSRRSAALSGACRSHLRSKRNH